MRLSNAQTHASASSMLGLDERAGCAAVDEVAELARLEVWDGLPETDARLVWGESPDPPVIYNIYNKPLRNRHQYFAAVRSG